MSQAAPSGVWELFEAIEKLGEGSYGSVYLARDRSKPHKKYAIKLLKQKSQGSSKYCDIPYTSLREVSILKDLDHPNIVKLLRVFFDLKSFGMIFSYYPENLANFIKQRKQKLTIPEIKHLVTGLLKGIDYLHQNGILHRDLKPENILLSEDGDPVIADFGLSRVIAQPLREYTNEVMTLHYRPPELVFGEKKYSIGVDLWALGCIFVELFTGEPLFRAKCELELLFKFCQILGTPTIENCPNLKEYYENPETKAGPPIRLPKNIEGLRLNEVLAGSDAKAIDLINKLLTYDPNKRITAKEALKHPFLVSKQAN